MGPDGLHRQPGRICASVDEASDEADNSSISHVGLGAWRSRFWPPSDNPTTVDAIMWALQEAYINFHLEHLGDDSLVVSVLHDNSKSYRIAAKRSRTKFVVEVLDVIKKGLKGENSNWLRYPDRRKVYDAADPAHWEEFVWRMKVPPKVMDLIPPNRAARVAHQKKYQKFNREAELL